MNAFRSGISIQVLVLCASLLPGQTINEDTLQRMQQQIRNDKFDHVLPKAMRDHGVDMWIHVIRDRNPDPIARDLGGESGVFVFTDRGGDRIERAILGGTDEALWGDEAYDLFVGEEGIEGDPGWQNVVGDFVAERDPQRIAVNFAKQNPLADGISHTDYETLVDALGEEYASRIVSAEGVIGDFVAGIVVGEIAFAGYFGMLTMQTLDEEFAKIEPGVTRLEQLDGNVFTLEYMVHMPVPECGPGKHLYIAFHDGAIVTPRGIEFPYPPDPGIRIIR